MKLNDIIIDYRNRMQISQREFSRKCGISNTYISFIENECNPKTGKPMIPTIEQYKKLANGMDISLQALFEMLDDSPVDLSDSSAPDHLTEKEKELLTLWRNAERDARKFAFEMLANHQKKDSLPVAK